MYQNPHPEPVRVAIIGGSGVYNLDCLQNSKLYDIDTPFGKPSAPICVAELPVAGGKSVSCAFLPRHGHGHSLNPSEVNYRANICALKILGAEYVIGINAVGSLVAEYKPGDFALVTDLIDKTFKRENTFFEKGIIAHVGFSRPTSELLNDVIFKTLTGDSFPNDGSFVLHKSATAVTMEGPQFSTQAESLWHKQSIPAHLIGMTSATEAKLAREAEMAYSIIAMVTDYDAWQDDTNSHVDVSGVMRVMAANAAHAQKIPPLIVPAIYSSLILASEGGSSVDPAHSALEFAVMTKPEGIPEEVKRRFAPLLASKYPRFAPAS